MMPFNPSLEFYLSHLLYLYVLYGLAVCVYLFEFIVHPSAVRVLACPVA